MKSEVLTVRAAGALPGAGAFDAAPTAVRVSGATAVDLHVRYTTAASIIGRPKLRVQWSGDAPATAPGSVVWEEDVLLDGSTLAKTAGWWSLEGGGQEIRLPTPGVAATLRAWRLPLVPPRGSNWLRVAAAEHGDAANPGSLELTAVLELL